MSFGESAANKNEYFNRFLEHEGEEDYVDRWNSGELLFLTSCVTRGDRNWVSVARVVKPYIGDYLRPPDWSTPKNCAFQYQRLLSEIDDDSKKKTVPRVERETSEVMLVRTLSEKRAKELTWLTQQTKAAANSLKTYIEMVESGDFDDNLDEILKQLEEQEKQQEDSYNEYLSMREKLIDSRKLNISRIKRGKVFSKAAENKKKISLSDPPESNPHHAVVEEVIKSIKKEMKSNEEFASPTKMSKSDLSPLKMMTSVKSEVSSMKMTTPIKSELEAAPITLNALLDSKVTIPSSVAPTSPLLTSLLRSIASPSPASHTLSASSSSLKEISPKAVSSPQPFFNPTSALATAAAQQLAVATSTIPLFQQHELSDSRKISLSSSPVTSACLSAPTLSKLLEMPPSTPGRLPPLPVLDPPSTPTPPVVTPTLTPSPTTSPQKPLNLLPPELLKTEDATRKAVQVPVVSSTPELQPAAIQLQQLQEEVLADVQAAVAASGDVEEVAEISDAALASVFDEAQLENIDILEAVCESINQAFEEKVTKKEDPSDSEKQKEQDDVIKNICPPKSSFTQASPDPVPLSIDVADKLPLMSLTHKPKTSPTLLKSEQILGPTSGLDASKEVMEDDKLGPGKKFYKSRTGVKKEETPEKTPDATSLLLSPKKAVIIKTESKSPVDAMEIPVVVEEPETKQLEAKAIKGSSETKPPPAKKPRLYENTPTEKPQELSEDEAVVRRSGRRGKKGRGRSAKNLAKTAEPKDQYEFTESTEENSVGYQANTLCYMPRLKEDSRADDSKAKSSAQEPEETPTAVLADKKPAISLRNKQGRPPSNQTVSVRKLFPSDEDRMSDSLTSDEASNHHLSEDKLKKWEETCEKKGDSSKGVGEGVKRTWKGIEISKKKISPPKKASSGKPGRKDRKPSSVDVEDVSTCSRDSEEVSGTDKEISEVKDLNAATPMDMEVETNDSHPCSSVAAESDKQMEDVEGGESFQGSVTTDFSPPPDVKEAPHFGKQDWMHNSPKSSEPVSQSSEESEYESDNWDNQSVSTNKSTSHSTGTQPRQKRKERETPEYKAWKKAISIVLREISCHKNANVFLQKVTNDVAPGYLSIVHQPMDLSLIKKNIDNGVVKTTSEFHRDMLLMFQNAIMYNSSDHDVHQMAVEMQKDVIEQIGAFLVTQQNSKNTASEPVTNLRGARTAKAQKGVGKHSASSSSKLKDDAD